MKTVGVSIPVPSPYREQLRAARRVAGDPLADKVPPHVTLMPPTDVARVDLPALRAHLARVASGFAPFPMVLRGTGTFRPVSPVVFVMVAVGIPLCEQLEQAVRGGPVDRDLEFTYHPHVTIAHHVPEPALDDAFASLADFTAAFDVRAFELAEQGEDETWRTVARFELAGPAKGDASD